MKERERLVVGGMVAVLLIVWLGFLFHSSPRFAGSLAGGVLAITGSALMLVPLAYLIIKRIKRLKNFVTRWVSMRTLLAWHIYAGVLGPILVLLHTGHKYESPLGIALTTMTIVIVVSGFIGRYLMSLISQEIKEKKAMLDQLRGAYDEAVEQVSSGDSEQVRRLRPFAGFFPRLAAGLFLADTPSNQSSNAALRSVRLAEAIADLEYAIRSHETFKSLFNAWLKVHIALSCVLYMLLVLHVWAAIHFGLRWFT